MSRNYLGNDQDAVDKEAREFVRSYLRGSDKDRDAARRLLMGRVADRYDPKSVAIKKILDSQCST